MKKAGGYYKKNYNNNNNNRNNKQKEEYHPSTNKVITAQENGFIGGPENWFDDKEFSDKLIVKPENKGEKDYYFNSYSSFYIHEEMIKDYVRTNSYRKAIEGNPEAFKDKIVLDIGCGTSILSIFAARAGAKHVYALEFADIADYAREIVKRNGLSDKITIIKSKVEEAVLPVDKVDIIISEWMGYFLLYESMLDTVLYARDKWLAKDGLILPDKSTIHIAGFEDVDYKKSKLDFWDGVGYDIDMTVLRPTVMSEPLIDVCQSQYINTNSYKILDIDLYTVKKEDLDFSSSYELTFNRSDSFSGLISWFDIVFSKLPNPVEFSTSPYVKATHWKQVVFYTEKDISVNRGDVVKGSFAARKSKKNPRELDVKISYHMKGYYTNTDFYQLYKIR